MWGTLHPGMAHAYASLMRLDCAGVVQRFSVGFRGPLCLISGFTGVSPPLFATGAAIGALGTMPIQLTVVGPLPKHVLHGACLSLARQLLSLLCLNA